MQYKFIDKIVDNVLVLMLIMSTGGMLFVLNRNIVSVIFFLLLVVVLFFGSSFKKTIFSSAVLSFSLVVLLGLINYVFAITEQTPNKYLFYLLTAIISTLIFFHFQNNRTVDIFLKRISLGLRIIALHAFLNFILFFFVKNNLHIISSTYHESETFMNLFFYTPVRGVIDIFGLEFCRNQGLFWEPGVLQVFLNILFFIEAFVIKKSKSILVFTSFLILTTYSTTGLGLLLLQAIIYMRSEFKTNKLFIPIIISLIIPIYLVFNLNLDNKIKGENESSFQKRIFDLTQPLFIALEYPLTGIGLDLFQFQKVRQEFYITSSSLQSMYSAFGIDAKVEVSDKGSSNSIMFLLAGTGFPTTILLMYMFFKQQIITEKKWLWMLIMLISVMSVPLLLRPFFFIFIISGFMNVFIRITSYKQQLV